MRKRIVITGLGIMAPNGHGLDEYESALRAGRSGIRFIPRLKELGFACQVGGVPQNFEELRTQYFDAEDLLSVNDNIGYAGIADLDVNALQVYLGDVLVAEKGGRAASYTEAQGAAVMREADITVRVVLNRGNASATVWTCDFSYDYVKINAEYRT